MTLPTPRLTVYAGETDILPYPSQPPLLCLQPDGVTPRDLTDSTGFTLLVKWAESDPDGEAIAVFTLANGKVEYVIPSQGAIRLHVAVADFPPAAFPQDTILHLAGKAHYAGGEDHICVDGLLTVKASSVRT